MQGFWSGSALFLEAGAGSALEWKAGPGSTFKSKFHKLSRLQMEAWKICRSVVADSHHLDDEKDPDPHWSEKGGSGSALKWKGGIRIRIKVKKIRSIRGSKWSRGEPWSLKMEAWRFKMEAWSVCRAVVADSHHLDEEQDPDAHWSENLYLVPGPH